MLYGDVNLNNKKMLKYLSVFFIYLCLYSVSRASTFYSFSFPRLKYSESRRMEKTCSPISYLNYCFPHPITGSKFMSGYWSSVSL